MQSKDHLQAALAEFTGTLLIVAHDRDFLEPLVTKVLEISHNSIRWYYGSLSHYVTKKAEEALAQGHLPTPEEVNIGMSSNERRQYNARVREQMKPFRKRLEECENRIAWFEEKISNLEEEMKDPDFFKRGEETQQSMSEYDSSKRKLERLFEDWEKATEQVTALEEELF